MIAALAGTQARVAAYTSPHLPSLRERIAIDGAPIDEGALVAAADVVRAAGGDALTFFEQVTAMACVAIADARVAVTVLEVGLGGRLDATNAVDAPVAVVTGVAMDHEAILGGTLERIAAEKAGIFKRGQRVVIGASGEPAAVPLLDAARASGAAASHGDRRGGRGGGAAGGAGGGAPAAERGGRAGGDRSARGDRRGAGAAGGARARARGRAPPGRL